MLGAQIFFTGLIFFVVGLFIVRVFKGKEHPPAYVMLSTLIALFGGLAAMVVGFLVFVWGWRV